ncbi:MAG TPA: PAC2 family protein [Nitriliruptorales bacterium]|nr:PAC2 family protein [Nitriliruptorales bacterium]
MQLLQFDGPLDETLVDPVLLVALDGWTDAGRCGSLAGEALRQQWHAQRLGTFPSDGLYDYRDRRPLLTIDRGLLADPVWPSLDVYQLAPPGGGEAVLIQGGEPDFQWQQLTRDIVDLAELLQARRYLGLGAVPAPVPHTRVTPILTTGSDEAMLDRYGRPHEHLTVPASCQVIVESALRDAGVTTLGLWARIPHYAAGEYPAGAHALLRHVAEMLGAELDLSDLLRDAEAHRQRLDIAANSSDDVLAHIRQLEQAYDQDVTEDSGFGPLPSGDEIAAELERFLRHQGGPDQS